MDTSGLPFPKPGKKTKKKTREQDPYYVWWIHGWVCTVPGCTTPWPVHAHHVVRRSQGGSDRSCVPLCHNHHVGNQGIHIKGVITFERMFNLNLLERVDYYNKMFAQRKAGSKQFLLPAFGADDLISS